MYASSRIRRQKEFLSFLLEKHQPHCYWCGAVIKPDSFNCNEGEVDPLTIHHVDENRENNAIENRVLIHKACHQQMHKLSTEAGVPAMLVREMKHRGQKSVHQCGAAPKEVGA
jgi:hypothetical protein